MAHLRTVLGDRAQVTIYTFATTIALICLFCHTVAGCFNLDPNRTLDIILQVFESKTDLGECLFIPLLVEYMPEYDTICQVSTRRFLLSRAC